MKYLLFVITLISLALPQPGGYRLTVNVNGIKPLKGELYVALHQRPQYFSIPDSAMMKAVVKIDSESETVTFKDVPAGITRPAEKQKYGKRKMRLIERPVRFGDISL